MDSLAKRLQASPVLARVAPFAIFLVLTYCQGKFGESSRYWFYLAKTVIGAWLVRAMWPVITEMRWTFSWEAVVVGVGVFALWVGIDGHYPSLNQLMQSYLYPIFRAIGLENWCKPAEIELPWNPHTAFGQGAPLAWLFIAIRILGSTLVVPPIEEVFYRSFFYRYVIKKEFLLVPLGTFHPFAFFATAAVFGFSHYEWLAAILCGLAYQGLVCRKNRLGDAMTAHAITNFLLGLWVVGRGAWHFW